MRPIVPATLVVLLGAVPPAAAGPKLKTETVARFAQLALECVHREYPNKITHVLQSDEDVLPPRQLTPSFFGCFDGWVSTRLRPIQKVSYAAVGKLRLFLENGFERTGFHLPGIF